MRAVDLIVKKRNGGTHSEAEIAFLIGGYVSGEIPEYQISAWAMAVYFSGMTGEETGFLTRAMIESGATIDLTGLAGPLIDKHSTGGVGDKVSLILAPIAAACGLQVPMMSGRALGHTGGTLDKLESIVGYSTAMDQARFREIITDAGYAMTGQSSDIVPADRLLYALRDVTGTVESIPMITASIMSKKFAEGAEALVFDVKSGSGAFMKTQEDATRLAQSLIDTGKSLGRRIVAVITRMTEPLGYMVGNYLEVVESACCLNPSLAGPEYRYPDDLMAVTFRLAAWMLVAGEVESGVAAAEEKCRAVVDSGEAYERFCRNVTLQGGTVADLAHDVASRRASVQREVTSPSTGYVQGVDAYAVGLAASHLGAGRDTADDDVLPLVGVEIKKKSGDAVRTGEVVCIIHAESESDAAEARDRVMGAYSFGSDAPGEIPLILDELSAL